MVHARLNGLKDTRFEKCMSICLKAISLPHLFPELALVTPSDPESEKWNRACDIKVTAQGLHAMIIRRPEFIMAFVEVKNSLHYLNGMTVKLRKRS